MPSLTIRNIPISVQRAIKARAQRNGRSTEAEVREILRQAAEPSERLRIGDELAALGEAFGGIELDLRRSKKLLKAASFS